MKRLADELENLVKKKARNEDRASAHISVKPSDVPVYLRESEFYRSLDMEENGVFVIPANHMKANTIVETLQDSCDLLQTVRFWSLDISLMPIFEYAITQPFCEIENGLQALEDEPFVEAMLHTLKNKDSIEEMIGSALECGNMDIVRWLRRREPPVTFDAEFLIKAASGGSTECLQYVHDNIKSTNMCGTLNAYVAAVRNGHLACLKFLEERVGPLLQTQYYVYPLRPTLSLLAAKYGQLECLQFLHEMGLSLDGCAMEAATHMQIPCLMYVLEHNAANLRNSNETLTIYHILAERNATDCLDLLLELKCEALKDVCLNFSQTGALSQLQYYIEHGGEWHLWTCHAAALNGHLHVLQFAHEHGCPLQFPGDSPQVNCEYCNRFSVNECPSHLVEMVAQRKHWECTRYLIQQQHPLTPGLAPQLAYNKQDDLLRLAVAHGCQLPTEVAVIYARRGFLEHLVFVMEHGCPPSSQIPWGAARCGRLPCLVYAHEHGCALDEFVCVGAARGGHLDCLQYAYKHGCRWGEEVCKAAVKGGSAECVQFAREHVVVEEDEETTSGEEER